MIVNLTPFRFYLVTPSPFIPLSLTKFLFIASREQAMSEVG